MVMVFLYFAWFIGFLVCLFSVHWGAAHYRRDTGLPAFDGWFMVAVIVLVCFFWPIAIPVGMYLERRDD